jgi:hypothetical protein
LIEEGALLIQIKVKVAVSGKPAGEATLEIEDYKLEELTEDELEGAIEVVVRTWANNHIEIAWETED